MRSPCFRAPQFFAACIAFLCATSVLAQSTPQIDAVAAAPVKQADLRPAEEQASEAPSPATARDYLAERRALAASPDYKPYPLLISERALIEEHFKRYNDPSSTVEQASEPLQTLIKAYPLGIRPNLAVANFMEYVANNIDDATGPNKELLEKQLLEIATKHRATAQGVIDSILSTGDGASTAAAWQVINQNEEYSLLEHLQLQPQDQALIFAERGPVDMFTVKAKDGTVRKVFFDVSLFFNNPRN